MSSYLSKDTTPMKFHKFVLYILLPIELLRRAYDWFLFFRRLTFHISLGLFDNKLTLFLLLVDLISFVFLIAAFIGLFKWKRYALICLLIYLLISAAHLFDSYIIQFKDTLEFYIEYPTSFLRVLPYALFDLFLCVALPIYYLKRKAFFFRKNTVQDTQFGSGAMDGAAAVAGNQTGTFIGEMPDERERPVYCRRCGVKLGEGADFCGNCGTKVVTPEDNSPTSASHG